MTERTPAGPGPQMLRAFVNGNAVSVPPGSTVLDAVGAWSPDEALAISAGRRRVADSRGLPVGADARVTGGAIFRTMAARRTVGPDDGSDATDVSDVSDAPDGAVPE